MRVITFKSISFFTILGLFMGMLLSGCSTNSEVNSVVKTHKSDKKVATKLAKLTPKALQHIHPSNPCTAAIDHSHLYVVEEHKHSYDCENTNEFVSNAHIHPVTKGNRRYRHVHPNGANKHSRNRQ